ncbi:MAG: ABC transporter ATP-binding protein [Deltaproteobacteria bacterium]|nr:ABC transporter ATP-binding protein [Deltaproteobacteria bacterium]
MIQMEGVSRVFGQAPNEVKAIVDLNMSIQTGEYVAIMGPSGSGKSTLLNLVGCLDRPSSGRYLLEDREISSLDDTQLSRVRNEVLGFVFQQFHLLPRLNALKNVMLPLIYAPQYPPHASEKAGALLSAVGLGAKLSARPGELSGGQQQRVAIARALINEPSVILADEPTGNLDKESGKEILDIFEKLNQDGRTVIIVTHDPEVADRARRKIVLEDGMLLSDIPIGRTQGGQA